MKKKKILVVEDHKKQSDLMVRCLDETELYHPIVAYNGEEALQAIKHHRRGFGFLGNEIACILLDWQMPTLSGEEFIERLRQSEHKNPFRHYIPIIVISAHTQVERRQLAESPVNGLVCEYLVKPIDEQKMLDLIYRIVFLHEAEVLREIFREQRSRWLAQPDEYHAQHGEIPK